MFNNKLFTFPKSHNRNTNPLSSRHILLSCELLENRELLTADPLLLDFGTSTSPVASGYTPLQTNSFDSDTGHGWSDGSNAISFHLDNQHDLLSDGHNGTIGKFRADLPNGDYIITAVVAGQQRVYESHNLIVGSPWLDLNGPSGQPTEVSIETTVNNGQLNLTFLYFHLFALKVEEVSSLPPVATNDSYSLAEDEVLATAVPGVLINDTGGNNGQIVAELFERPTHGTLAFRSDGSFLYTPIKNFHGTDSFKYRVFDGDRYSEPASVDLRVTPRNDIPTAVDDNFTTQEDRTLNGRTNNLLINDSDVDGDTLFADLLEGPSHGELTLNPNGTFQYIPDPNFNGTDTFTYRTFDGNSYSNNATVNIAVQEVNDPPTAVNDLFSIKEDQTVTVDVLANDTDVDGDQLVPTLIVKPIHGKAEIGADNTIKYIPNKDYFGDDSFTYHLNDGKSQSSPAVVALNISPVNDAPVAVDDEYISGLGNRVVGNVLTNDSDVDSTDLQATVMNAPNHGTLELQPDGQFYYTPNDYYFGTDSFTYRVDDGSLTSILATVRFHVQLPIVSGVAYEYYKLSNLTQLPDFDSLVPTDTGVASTFTIDVSPVRENFALRFRGFIEVPVDGEYDFFTKSDDGSRLYINDNLVVDNDGVHAKRERSGAVQLAAGKHDIVVEFFERSFGEWLQVKWSGPGIPKQLIPTDVLSHIPNADIEPLILKNQSELTTLEGTDLRFDGESTGGFGHLTYTWDFGDGSSATGQSVTYAFSDNGVYDVRLTVSDERNQSVTDTFSVTVTNVAPGATFSAPSEATQSESVILNFSNISDASNPDTQAGFLFSYDLDGDGVFELTLVKDSTIEHTFHHVGNYTIRARVIDKDGDWTEYFRNIQISSPPNDNLPLLYQDNLNYVGAFRVPNGTYGESSFAFGGTAPAYNPTNNSLYLVGHRNAIAEISIPDEITYSSQVSELNTSTILQPFSSIWDKVPNKDTIDSNVSIGGLMMVDGQLVGTVYEYYDGNYSANVSHFRLDNQNIASANAEGLFRVGNLNAGFVAGYMAEVPTDWQKLLGTTHVTGQAALPVISRTSWGPGLFGFDPRTLSESGTTATPLVYYSSDHPLGTMEGTANPLFNGATLIDGVVFAPGSRSVLFFGSHGTNDVGYGEAAEFNDGNRGNKGYHSRDGKYEFQIWAYDVLDLAAVQNGEKQPWDIQPYSVWNFDFPTFTGNAKIGGVTFDPNSGRIYVSQLAADVVGYNPNPIIHVFDINTSRPPVETFLKTPTQGDQLRVDSVSRSQVQAMYLEALGRWSAAGADVSELNSIRFRITDLADGSLSHVEDDTIWLDMNAAGHGWFIDMTPNDDSEFLLPGDQGEENRIDLLTVLVHEVGHLLGIQDLDGTAMDNTLLVGSRNVSNLGTFLL